jgi:thiamine biosynthesis lipoprotein
MTQLEQQCRSTGKIGRRRFLSISAAASGAAIFSRDASSARPESPYRWRGLALGAEADLTLYAASRTEAMDAVDACLRELARLEAIFSLHQPGSALMRLNAAGTLDEPPQEMVELLSEVVALAWRSGGLFDPTIQPLWEAVAAHFREHPGSEPDAERFADARALVDYRLLDVTPSRISLRKPGMRVTLNGIAQGFISDKVAELLRSRGFDHALVNLGEAVVTGAKPTGGPWQLDIPNPLDRSETVGRISLASGAAATSSGAGLVFDRDGRFTHILHPHLVTCAPVDRSVTVLAPSASLADGLSTLAVLAGPDNGVVESLISDAGARALVVSKAGRSQRWIG